MFYLKTIGCLLLLSVSINPQIDITIDLSKQQSGTEITIPIQNTENPTVVINSMVPSRKYNVAVDVIIKQNEPLDLKNNATNAFMQPPSCNEIKNALKELIEEQSEIEIPKKLKILEGVIEKAKKDPTQCEPNDLIKLLLTADIFKSKTFMLIPLNIYLSDGKEILVTIVRKKEGNETEDLTWKMKFKTEKEGFWQTSYGFAFVPSFFYQNEEFFTVKTDTAFKIGKAETNQRKLVYVPSLFFNWIPMEDIAGLSWGVTGGLGFDLTNPVLFLGFSSIYRQNLGFHFGLAFIKRQRLLGKYKEGQVIEENLEGDQLHQSVYKLDLFFAISYNLSSNPFSTSK